MLLNIWSICSLVSPTISAAIAMRSSLAAVAGRDGFPEYPGRRRAAAVAFGSGDMVRDGLGAEPPGMKKAPPPAPPHCDGEGSKPTGLPSPSQWGGAGGGAFSVSACSQALYEPEVV